MVFLFGGRVGVCEGTDGKNMVFRERAVAEGLVDLRQRVSGNELSIGDFRAGLRHDGLERLGFLLFLSRPQDAFAARYVFWTGAFAFNWEDIVIGEAGMWVTGLRIQVMGVGCHFCWRSSGRVL